MNLTHDTALSVAISHLQLRLFSALAAPYYADVTTGRGPHYAYRFDARFAGALQRPIQGIRREHRV